MKEPMARSVANPPAGPPRVLYAKPSITSREIAYVEDAIRHGWGEHCNDYLLRFEQALARYLEVPSVMATSSCTGALQLALAALGVGPGDEVIVPDITWIASVAPIVHAGARPVLVDVLPESWCLDPARVRAALTPRTKAIIAVHLYGNLCAVDELLALRAETGIPLIEDAAEALGSTYRGRKAGSFGDFAVFSFHGTKTQTTGEGGALCSTRPDLWERVRTLAEHGRRPGEPVQFWCSEWGFKFKMWNLQAALGLAQLERLGELVARKRELFARYAERLGRLPGVALNPEPPGCVNSYWMSTVVWERTPRRARERLLAELKEAAIDARIFFHPISRFPMLAHETFETPVAHDIAARGLNLPCYHDLEREGQERVCDVIEHFLRETA